MGRPVAADRIAVALSAGLSVRLRAAPDSVAVEGGWVLRGPAALAKAHRLNAIVLGAGGRPRSPLGAGGRPPGPLDADAVLALARRWRRDGADECVEVDDETLARGFAPALHREGFETGRMLLMARCPDPPPPPADDDAAHELTEDELSALELSCLSEQVPGPAGREWATLLAGAQAQLRGANDVRRFGAAPPGGDAASICTLFLDSDVRGRRVALLDSVATLREHRQQGLARAAVSAALRAACGWRADLIVVTVDADDWPQLLYASLGFAPLCRRWQFTRRASV